MLRQLFVERVWALGYLHQLSIDTCLAAVRLGELAIEEEICENLEKLAYTALVTASKLYEDEPLSIRYLRAFVDYEVVELERRLTPLLSLVPLVRVLAIFDLPRLPSALWDTCVLISQDRQTFDIVWRRPQTLLLAMKLLGRRNRALRTHRLRIFIALVTQVADEHGIEPLTLGWALTQPERS